VLHWFMEIELVDTNWQVSLQHFDSARCELLDNHCRRDLRWRNRFIELIWGRRW